MGSHTQTRSIEPVDLPGMHWLPGRRQHLPALDGIRTVAIALVLGTHLGFLRGGFIGVTVFFSLSGFLITSLLLEERLQTGKIAYRAFYLRRLARLYPALILTLIISGLGALMTKENWGDLWIMFVVSALYLTNIFGTMLNRWLPFANQTWTLAQEEQFYLIAPRLVARINLGKLPAWGVSLLLVASGLGLLRYGATVAWPDWYISTYENPILNLDAMTAGVGLAFLTASRSVPRWLRGLSSNSGVLFVGLVGIVAVAYFARLTDWTMAPAMTVTVFVTLVALVHVSESKSSTASYFLSLRWMRWLGDRSYGIYLYNFGVIKALQLAPLPHTWWAPILLNVCFVGVTIVAAALSYRFIEDPIRKWARGRLA